MWQNYFFRIEGGSMNAYWYCLLSKVVAVTGFVTLAMDDKPWLGLLCFIVLASIDGPLKEQK